MDRLSHQAPCSPAKEGIRSVEPPAFFVVGTQRSGTTLLRLLLNAHSDVALPEDADFLMPYLQRRRLLDPRMLRTEERQVLVRYLRSHFAYKKWRLGDRDLDGLLDLQCNLRQAVQWLYSVFGAKHGKQICGDKTPSFIRKLGLLLDAFPDAKVVHIVRDGRDTYVSLRERGEASASSIAVAALEWRTKLWLVRRALAGREHRAMELRYEDLLQTPIPCLERVCGFLGIPFEEQMLGFWKQSEDYIDHQHSALIFKPIDPSNAGKWRTDLSEAEVRAYEYFARRPLTHYGYELACPNVTTGQALSYCAALGLNLPRRLARIARISITMRVASRFGLAYRPREE